MAIEERDLHSGYMTTGHEWNGIKELNTPVPGVVYFFLWLTLAFAVIYWLLMPAWPLGLTYTKGFLRVDQRTAVAATLKDAALERAAWTDRIEKSGYREIQTDAGLMRIVRQTGHALFADNCAACHGADAKGRAGFPNLTAGAWLWGGDADAIAETLRVGINSDHAKSRVSQMLAFGRDGLLKRSEIEDVAAYVLSLSATGDAAKSPSTAIVAGKNLFAANCVGCHGDDAKGKRDVGGPDLTDANWLYGGGEASVFASIYNGRQGHMPTWEKRLTPVQRKVLALYVLDLGVKAK